jgi:hypothetical protein
VKDYSLKLSDFLGQISPEFELPESLSFLKDKTITSLNILLDLVKDLYVTCRDNLADIGSAFIHVINFYLGSKNSTSWADFSVSLASLCLSLFRLDTVKNSAKYVQQIVGHFVDYLKTFFIKGESAEKSIRSFWSDLSVSNPRTLFGIIHSCAGIMTSVICVKNFVHSSFQDKDIVTLISELSTGILKVGSDVRHHMENITVLLARIYDWIFINAEALMTLQFDKIQWELPKDQVFESRYVEIKNIMSAYIEDPLYLEANNLTLLQIRDMLNKLRASGEGELNKSPVPSVKSALTRYMTTIDDWIRLVEARLNPDNTKPQPMAVTLVGPAGCGKSSASTKLGLMMQVIAGHVPDETLLNNRGGDPKFEENITGSTDVIIFDDYANDQSQKMSTKDVLDIVNTSREVIPKSRAEEKGAHKYNNIGTIFTTNDHDLGVNCFKTASVDSLLRRMGLVVNLSIKEEYCVPGTDRLDINHPAVQDEVFNTDVYAVKLQLPRNAIVSSTGGKCVVYVDVEFERHEGNNEWRDAVLKIQELLIEHWRSSVYRHEKSKSKEHLCEKCSLPFDVCLCGKIQAESLSIYRERFVSLFYNRPMAAANQRLYALDNYTIDFSSRLTTMYSLMVFYKNLAAYAKDRVVHYRAYWYIYLFLFLVFASFPFGAVFFFGAIAAQERSVYLKEKAAHFERSVNMGSFIRDSYRARYMAIGAIAFTGMIMVKIVFTSLFAASQVMGKAEEMRLAHPSVTPSAELLSKEEDAKVESVSFLPKRENTNSDEIGYFITRPRPAHEARTMTADQVIAEIGKGIAVATISDEDSERTVKTLPFGSERLIPLHALSTKGVQDIIIQYGGPSSAEYKNIDVPQTHIKPLVKREGMFASKQLDAAVVHLPNMPPGKDFSKFLAAPGTLPEQAGCFYIHKDAETGEYKKILVRARMLPQKIRYETDHGVEYQQVYECQSKDHYSQDGDCGQPLIYNNSIIGIHIAGNSSRTWYCMALDKSTFEAAHSVLKQESSIFVASKPPEPVFKNNKKNLFIMDGETSYVTEMLKTAVTPIVSLGVVVDAAKQLYKPRAEDYYFRNGNTQIEAEFGPMSSRPPRHVNGAAQINTTLLKFNTPKMDVPINLMDRAMNDYLRGNTHTGKTLAQVANSFEIAEPGFFSVRSLQQALDGDQTGVVRGMNNKTSSGICYGGKKTNWIAMIGDDPVVPRVLDEEVERDIYKIEESWRSGQGTFDPFVRASKVNEVLPLQKAEEKTRSVYGNDMAFFLAATRGIIPLKHVLRDMHISECFVGLTAQSKEWAELHQYITKNGTYTKFVCGDFSGYDTQLPKALLEKSAALILQIYRENGASESDLEYLRGFLSSVVSPVMIWEGQLMQFCSGQPSGQPLTVEMNSIVNSILLRMAFYTIMDREYPEIKNPNFRDYVRAAVYGDDNLMGVDDSIPMFNHTSIQAVFASWGIKYTMAEKEADSVPFQTIDEVSFLKRSFRFHPQLNSVVAPIEEESLSKKFYWWTKSKNTPLTFPEQFSANFESQSREAYLHGEEFYKEFVDKCERIVAASEDGDERFVLPWNTIQPLSCDEMCRNLISKYHPEEEQA